MIHTRGQRVVVSIGVVLCFLAVLAVASPAAADGHTNPPPVAETFEAGDSVAVWERSFLTLRADAGDASATVPNADWRVRSPNSGEVPLNRDPIPVYDAGSQVGFEFDEDRANEGGLLGDADVQVVRAHVPDTDEAPSSFADAVELLTDDGNEDATFAPVTSTQLADGAVTFTDTPDEAGDYLYFLVKAGGDGLAISDGELSVESPVTVLGTERVGVRSGTGGVTAPDSVSPGENATFEVDASQLSGDAVSQTVVLYDEDAYLQQSFVVDATGEIDEDFDFEDDSRLETTVSEVNGVTTVRGGDGRYDDGSVGGVAGIESIVDFVSEGGASGTSGVAATDDARLDASVTSIEQSDPVATVEVGTLGNWSEGDYRWIYQATGTAGEERYVATDVLEVRAASDDESSGGSGDDDDRDSDDTDDADDDDDESSGVETDCEEPPTPSVAVSGNQVTGTIECVDAEDVIPLELGLETSTETVGVTFERLNVTAADGAEDVYASVESQTSTPENVTAAPQRYRALSYLTVELENLTDAATSEATVGFRISNSTLADLAVAPEDVALLRYHDGSWKTLETTHRGGDRFRARTPGFSAFAVGVPTADIAVTDTTLGSTSVQAGETVQVTATIENGGTRSGSKTVRATAGDAASAAANVTLGAGNETTETFALDIADAGTYDVTVGGVAAGTVSVDDGGQTSTETPATGEVGGGAALPMLVLVAAVGLVAVAAAIYYRRL